MVTGDATARHAGLWQEGSHAANGAAGCSGTAPAPGLAELWPRAAGPDATDSAISSAELNRTAGVACAPGHAAEMEAAFQLHQARQWACADRWASLSNVRGRHALRGAAASACRQLMRGTMPHLIITHLRTTTNHPPTRMQIAMMVALVPGRLRAGNPPQQLAAVLLLGCVIALPGLLSWAAYGWYVPRRTRVLCATLPAMWALFALATPPAQLPAFWSFSWLKFSAITRATGHGMLSWSWRLPPRVRAAACTEGGRPS